ncbi:MAG: hypothetical protein ABIS67_06650 [Candidatus Eisenbacteria bacterium]
MLKRLWIALLFAAALPAAALAQSSSGTGPIATAWGPRFGFSSGPDQFLFGGQLDLGDLAPDLTLTPNVDIGIGDNATTIGLNGDIHYHFRVQNSPWRPYVGAGIAFTHINVETPGGDYSDTDVGLAIIGGAIVPTQSGSRFFIEGKLGLGDVHDFKLLIGWNFRL